MTELGPLRRTPLPTQELQARRKQLPSVDREALRRDIDDTIDQRLLAGVAALVDRS